MQDQHNEGHSNSFCHNSYISSPTPTPRPQKVPLRQPKHLRRWKRNNIAKNARNSRQISRDQRRRADIERRAARHHTSKVLVGAALNRVDVDVRCGAVLYDELRDRAALAGVAVAACQLVDLDGRRLEGFVGVHARRGDNADGDPVVGFLDLTGLERCGEAKAGEGEERGG